MIRVGMSIHQTVYCPSCGQVCRVIPGESMVLVTVYCNNPKCDDNGRFFTIDRMLGRVVEVEQEPELREAP